MMDDERGNPSVATGDIATALDRIEGELITLIREGAHGGRPLTETIVDLGGLLPEIGLQFEGLQSLLAARDLTFETKVRLDGLRARLVWLYRKARLEELFFVKLQLERAFRDELYQRVLETYDEFTDLERRERVLRDRSDDELAAELLRDSLRDRARPEEIGAVEPTEPADSVMEQTDPPLAE